MQLETLRLKQANDSVTLAQLQQQRALIQENHYQKLLDEGLIEAERSAIEDYGEAAIYQATAADLSFAVAAIHSATVAAGAIAGGVMGGAVGGPAGAAAGAAFGALGQSQALINALNAVGAGYGSLAAKRSTRAQMNLALAGFERRRQEWELSVALARQDVAIGGQQVTIATDGVDIARQERLIAETRQTHAKDTVAFLANKFTNVELYDWMGDVLEGVYSYFLQQATSTAKLAENQLAFERQEPPAAFIQADYWEAPDDSMPTDNVQGAEVDRRGLTGSARLLQDLYRLDQYSFDTNKRKLQLSKTISLALSMPTELQRFRETGVVQFATPMSMFDRDFPGHYLRLIKSVRTSVIALIPPSQGIHATLSTSGMSRVVIGPDIFQTVPIRRDPELVALTSPSQRERCLRARSAGVGDAAAIRGLRHRHRVGTADAEGREPVRLPRHRRRPADDRLHGASQLGLRTAGETVAAAVDERRPSIQLPQPALGSVVRPAQPGADVDADGRAVPHRAGGLPSQPRSVEDPARRLVRRAEGRLGVRGAGAAAAVRRGGQRRWNGRRWHHARRHDQHAPGERRPLDVVRGSAPIR